MRLSTVAAPSEINFLSHELQRFHEKQIPRFRLNEKYCLIRKLASGGLGYVDLAENSSGQKVAMKIPKPCSKIALRLFQNEAMALERIRHPNVVELLDHDPEFPFIVMEYLNGTHVKSFAKDLNRVLSISIELCDSLYAIHSKGIIHRDLKPDNMLIVNGHVKLLDFGYCKIIGDWDYSNFAGHHIGTAGYMAPEQTYTASNVDQRADLYSLGISMYELISGELPFEDDDASRIISMHRLDIPEPLHKMGNTPESVSLLVARALSKKPCERFNDAMEMKEALIALASSL